jgi:hypothetical protein
MSTRNSIRKRHLILQAFAGKKNCMAELDRPETPEGYFRSRNHNIGKKIGKNLA